VPLPSPHTDVPQHPEVRVFWPFLLLGEWGWTNTSSMRQASGIFFATIALAAALSCILSADKHMDPSWCVLLLTLKSHQASPCHIYHNTTFACAMAPWKPVPEMPPAHPTASVTSRPAAVPGLGACSGGRRGSPTPLTHGTPGRVRGRRHGGRLRQGEGEGTRNCPTRPCGALHICSRCGLCDGAMPR
jgi:hypothetical protein